MSMTLVENVGLKHDDTIVKGAADAVSDRIAVFVACCVEERRKRKDTKASGFRG